MIRPEGCPFPSHTTPVTGDNGVTRFKHSTGTQVVSPSACLWEAKILPERAPHRGLPAVFFLSIPFPTQFNAAVTTVGSEKPRTLFTVFSTHGFSSSSSRLERAILGESDQVWNNGTGLEHTVVQTHTTRGGGATRHSSYAVFFPPSVISLIHQPGLASASISTLSPPPAGLFRSRTSPCKGTCKAAEYQALGRKQQQRAERVGFLKGLVGHCGQRKPHTPGTAPRGAKAVLFGCQELLVVLPQSSRPPCPKMNDLMGGCVLRTEPGVGVLPSLSCQKQGTLGQPHTRGTAGHSQEGPEGVRSGCLPCVCVWGGG